ncbi:MAG TPA: sugar phosphate isomerase/epimerase family protein [Caulifigura sp.]|nr:sugar phosphate isomerase/epimerase family protein [Caulifigura sp.]
MDRLRIAIATTGLAATLRESIDRAAQSGAHGVQFDVRSEVAADQFGATACQQLRHLAQEHGLDIASATFPLRRPLYDPVELDGRVHVVREAIKLCGRLKCRTLTLRIGRIPEEQDAPARVRLLGALSDLARVGAQEGVTPAISTSGDSPSELARLVEEVKDGPVGIDLDPAGCISTQLAPVTVLRSLHESMLHVQGRDAVRDLETGAREVPLGRGETPWDELLATLADCRYRGWITIRRTTGSDRLLESANAVRYLRTVAEGG